MEYSIIFQLGIISFLAILAQIISAKSRAPSILLLLAFGFFAGPVMGVVQPRMLFGELLNPLISFSVALILFEGGLSLRFKEIQAVKTAVLLLVTLGCLIGWILASGFIYYFLNLNLEIALLIGAILTVSGPTVIIPLLRVLRLKEPLSSILKWESILIDSSGALLSVMIFEIIAYKKYASAYGYMLEGIALAVLSGTVLAVGFALVISYLLRRFLIPDHLINFFVLSLVILSFIVSNYIQKESGLITVTLMGVILANQKKLSVKSLLEFKESLRTMLISYLFIILSALFSFDDFSKINWLPFAAFMLVLIFIIRPLVVCLCTIGSGLSRNQKLAISFVAPRGIVAASVSSLFALELSNLQVLQAEMVQSYVFMTIIVTVSFYSMFSAAIIRKLQVAVESNSGVLIIGISAFSIELAKFLATLQIQTILSDTNKRRVLQAIESGVEAVDRNFLVQELEEEQFDLSRFSKLLALTPNDNTNSVAVLKFTHIFSQSGVFQLAPTRTIHEQKEKDPLKGRLLFRVQADWSALNNMVHTGATIRLFSGAEFTLESLQSQYGSAFLPLAMLNSKNNLEMICTDTKVKLSKENSLIALVG